MPSCLDDPPPFLDLVSLGQEVKENIHTGVTDRSKIMAEMLTLKKKKKKMAGDKIEVNLKLVEKSPVGC